MKIKKVTAREIFNSKNQPTIEVTINNKFTASAPAGTSTGKHAKKLYPVGGIKEAIKELKRIKGIIINEFEDLEVLEEITKDLGANPTIALEFAALKALSKNKVWQFLNPYATKIPTPLGNVVGGGAHFKGKASDFQEFLLIPRTKKFFNAALANELIHNRIKRKFNPTQKTYENAWVLPLSTKETLEFLTDFLSDMSKELGFKIDLGLDVAASSLWKGHSYVYDNFSKEEPKKQLSPREQIEFINLITRRYNLAYIEDPLHEDDFDGFAKIKGFAVGDDLITTDIERLKKADINAVIIKPNQIGSLIKTKEVVDYAKNNDIIPVISHRSGETMDNTISHLAVAWNIPYIKCGIVGKERKAKINELIRIEREIKD